MSDKLKQNHLDFIDFIKGFATISVILLHTLPHRVLYDTFAVYHIWQAVPIFLFITFYLGFRNLEKKPFNFRDYYTLDRIKKIFLKLWLPLIILAFFEAIFFMFCGTNDKAMGSLLCYNNGPGSYYIWLYMQIWLLLPLIYILLKKTGIILGGCLLMILGHIGDFGIETYFGITPKFLCFRYIFMSVPALMYLRRVNNKGTTFLAIISIVYLYSMHYSEVPILIDPILPNGWEAQTSLGFFYTLCLFVLLKKCYAKIKNTHFANCISNIGHISWEVFLVQMVLLGSGIVEYTSARLFVSPVLQVCYKVLIVLFSSLFFAKLYKRVLLAILKRIGWHA